MSNLPSDSERVLPDLLGIMFDQSARGMILGQLALGARDHLPLRLEQNGAG